LCHYEVFLRLIEYYEGILFLTTNRLDDFDEAFQSRIHLTINYPDLSSDQRTLIWKNILERVPGSWSPELLGRLGREYTVNGREIKNIVRTALALAIHQEVPLGEVHIQKVYNLNWKARVGVQRRSSVAIRDRRISFANPVAVFDD
jgi:SpoVK/Ycf46/Vps4 family AAA+-type ATPase